ncbi:MAG TPA: S8 family serine peptidase [Pyrinomonadaceae bacterium]|jgi:subtilisin family serine protease
MKKHFYIFLLLLGFIALPAEASAQGKIKVTKADELPRRTVEIKGKAIDLVANDAELDRLAAERLKYLLEDLDTYDIADASVRQGYYGGVLQIYLYRRDYEKVLEYARKIRDLETKPALKLTSGIFVEAYVNALRASSDEQSAQFKQAFEKYYGEAYRKLPYDEISPVVNQLRAQLSLQNKEAIFGSLENNLQPVLDKNNGVVPAGVVAQLLGVKFALEHQLPLAPEIGRVINALYEANNKTLVKNDIWAARGVDFASPEKLSPVVVAVWDSGTDVAILPPENRWQNARETFNGRDDDDNGFVDDVYGIGYDFAEYKKSVGTLMDPAGRIKSDVKFLQRLTKGSYDLQGGIESAEAAELQKTYAALKRDDYKSFAEELSFYTNYSHGTHVAGIAAAGNPAAKILGARMSWDYRATPPVPTVEKSKFTAQAYRDIVDYFKRQKVRVVNMSWRYNSASYEAALTANGVGKDAAQRKKLARELFEIERAALFEAIKNAPDILFVCGSGNENNSADFSEYIPASFNLPNLVTIGAVDSEGRKTAFTTEGASVDFYANGYEVESYVPGGDRIRMSGTSMSSPQVANLAAKLLAVEPRLTPAKIIKLIADGAEASTEDPKIKLINPRKTFALLKK